MSYILKALSRSTRSRSQRSAPDLATVFDAPPVAARNRPGRVLPLAALLLPAFAVALFLGWFLLSPGSQDPPAAVAGDRPALRPAAVPAEPEPSRAARPPDVPVASLLLQSGTAMPTAGAVKPGAAPPRGRDIPQPLLPAVTGPPAAAPAGDSAPDQTPRRVTSLRGVQLLVHIYSEEPGERFVLINGARYREGERLRQLDATLVGITPEGVLLDLPDGRVHLLFSSR